MEIIFLNKYVRKFKRYFIISILFYLTISNDLVLGKGGGKGGKSGKGDGSDGGIDGGSDVGTSNNKVSSSDKISSSYTPTTSHSRSSWVFFYYGGGQRYCGNLCILTAVLVPTIIILIIGCGIWKCYRFKKRNERNKAEIEKNSIGSDDDNANLYGTDYNNAPIAQFPTPVTLPPTYYPTLKNDFNYTPNYYNLDDNYTNYAHSKLSPSLTELDQVKSSSRRESFDSMEEFKKNKK